MTTVHKAARASIGAVLLLASLGTSIQVHGAAPSSFGGELRDMTRIKGSVVCMGCRLEDVKKAQADAGRIYELQHPNGQRVVLRVDWVDDAAYWESITLGHQLVVRTPDKLWRELTAEKNLFQPMEISGLLRSNRTFDLASIVIGG